MHAQYADEFEVVSCYAEAHHKDEFAYATCYANEFEFNLHGASISYKEVFVSIQIITDNINF